MNEHGVSNGNNEVYGEVMKLVDGASHVIDSIDELEKYFEDSDEIMYERKEKTVFL